MTTAFKASLEAAIDAWLQAHCEDDNWPQDYCPPTLAVRMTDAATTVFDASFEAAAYTSQENGVRV